MIKVLKETSAVIDGSYKEFTAGKIYGPETNPQISIELESQAISEGWAVAWDSTEDLLPALISEPEVATLPALKKTRKRK